MRFTHAMNCFSLLWQDLKCHNFSLHCNTSFTCDMSFLHPLKWGFFRGFHCDGTLNVIVLTCIMTWVSHVKWIYFSLPLQDLKCHSFSSCHNTSFTCDMRFLIYFLIIYQYWSIFQFEMRLNSTLLILDLKTKGSKHTLFIKLKHKLEPIHRITRILFMFILISFIMY
jgi:hypothetical protein